ncbi:MAG: type I-E CRISPR-associated protein Cas7/Cse4/CasC [Elusimicrobia bacterium]|nr:type I-E CRISPR-associated protein Cas7/Cse4/CasC [Elusimicrobiota bacterium]
MNNVKNFLNIHVLISHSPSCLNRDDMNMQKTAVFGGVRRVRISSQSLKHAMRMSDYFKEKIGDPSVRTRELAQLKLDYIKVLGKDFDEKIITDIVDRISGTGAYKEEKTGKGKKIKSETPDSEAVDVPEQEKNAKTGQAVAPWSIEEVRRLCEITKKTKDKKELDKKLKDPAELLKVALSKDSLDIALFGRMATSGIMTSIDGAMSVAHVITTHSVDADVDWFTAVDDLAQEKGESGAGHLNTQEFGAGVFYRYASINIKQLQDNIGGSREEALKAAKHLVHMLAIIVPIAKQHSFAAHNPADLVMVSFGDLPLSAANAFEKPVEHDENGGFIQPSIKQLENYYKKVTAAYGLDKDPKAVFSIWDTSLEPKKSKLSEIEDWVEKDGK